MSDSAAGAPRHSPWWCDAVVLPHLRSPPSRTSPAGAGTLFALTGPSLLGGKGYHTSGSFAQSYSVHRVRAQCDATHTIEEGRSGSMCSYSPIRRSPPSTRTGRRAGKLGQSMNPSSVPCSLFFLFPEVVLLDEIQVVDELVKGRAAPALNEDGATCERLRVYLPHRPSAFLRRVRRRWFG